MIRPQQHPQHMRGYQSYEADAAADGYAYTDDDGHGNHHRQLYPLDGNAQVLRLFLPEGKGVQRTGTAGQHSPPGQQE